MRCHLIARLLSSLGRDDVLFAPGMKLPMRPATLREIDNSITPSGYILNPYPIVRSEDKDVPHENDAVELIERMVKENANNITLVCIGPLTNIAAALCRYPEIKPLIRSIAIMGGELQSNRAEHNVAWDSSAAEIVFASEIPMFVGTWGVTRDFVLSPEDCQRIGEHPSPLCQMMHEAIELWWPYKAHKPSPVMYDVAPILWTYAPEYFTMEAINVKVENSGAHTRGFTIRGNGEPNAQVTLKMEVERIRELYLETIFNNV